MEFQPKDLLPLLKMLSEKYTSKSSTSVSYETAQQIMGAILYCIQEFEHHPHDARQNASGGKATALMGVDSITAECAYEQGYVLVVEKIKQAHDLYNRIMTNFDGFGNEAYVETLVDGLPEFFKWYDPKFAPRNHIILIDYPILYEPASLTGIDLIYDYLKAIELEQLFLSAFPKGYVRNVLSIYHRDYSELLLNVPEIVLKHVLVNLLLKKGTPVISFDDTDCERLRFSILQTNSEAFGLLLENALTAFIDRQMNGDKNLLYYLKHAIPNISVELINAAENNCMNVILGGDLYG